MELQLQNLRKQYKEKCAVDNVSATLMPGVEPSLEDLFLYYFGEETEKQEEIICW